MVTVSAGRSISPLGAFMLCIAAFACGVSAREMLPGKPGRPCPQRVTCYDVVPGTVWAFGGHEGDWHVLGGVRVGPGPNGTRVEITRCVPGEGEQGPVFPSWREH